MASLEKRLGKARRRGDGEAIRRCHEEAFELYSRLVRYIAFEILRNEEEAKDATMEAFLAFMKGSLEKDISSIKYYLVRSVDRISRRMLEKRHVPLENDGLVPARETTHATRHDLEKALLGLNEAEAEIFALKAHYGYTFKEIAEMKGMTEDSVSGKYTRSLKKAREALGGKDR